MKRKLSRFAMVAILLLAFAGCAANYVRTWVQTLPDGRVLVCSEHRSVGWNDTAVGTRSCHTAKIER